MTFGCCFFDTSTISLGVILLRLWKIKFLLLFIYSFKLPCHIQNRHLRSIPEIPIVSLSHLWHPAPLESRMWWEFFIVWRDAAQVLEGKHGVRNRARLGDSIKFRSVQFVSDIIHKKVSLFFVCFLPTICYSCTQTAVSG